MKTRVGVIGCNGNLPKSVKEIAEYIGEDIGRRGLILVCGGLGGVMEASCRGAKKAGSLTVGILPTNRKEDANPYVDVVITTGLGYTRNALVVSSSDVLIVINGREGTLSEVAFALVSNKPVVAVLGSGGIADVLEEKLKELGISKKIYSVNVSEAVEFAVSLLSESP